MQPNFRTTPPTDQTEHARGLKFCMASPHDSLLRVIEAIFDKSPLSRDMGVGWGALGGQKKSPIFQFFLLYSGKLMSYLQEKHIFNPYSLCLGWFFHF